MLGRDYANLLGDFYSNNEVCDSGDRLEDDDTIDDGFGVHGDLNREISLMPTSSFVFSNALLYLHMPISCFASPNAIP